MKDFQIPEKFAEKGMVPFGVQLYKIRTESSFDYQAAETHNKQMLESMSAEDQAEFRRLDRETNTMFDEWKVSAGLSAKPGQPQSPTAAIPTPTLSPQRKAEIAIGSFKEELQGFFDSVAELETQANVYHPDKLKEMQGEARNAFEAKMSEVAGNLASNVREFENQVEQQEAREMIAYHPENETQEATFESMKGNLFNLYSMKPDQISADYEKAMAAGDSRKIAFFEEFGPAILDNSTRHRGQGPALNATIMNNQSLRISDDTEAAKKELKHLGLAGKYAAQIVSGISSGNDYGSSMFAINTLLGNERLTTQQSRLFGSRGRGGTINIANQMADALNDRR